MTWGHIWALALFGLVAAATWWDPPWPVEQALHSSLTLVALAALAQAVARRRRDVNVTNLVSAPPLRGTSHDR